jgi:antitoxin component YwqK of YwqJK toxin-antitoxin module
MKKWIMFLLLMTVIIQSNAQRVFYSEPDKTDIRQTNFEIIGKIDGNILIYKSLRDNHSISLYDMEMRQTDKVKLDFLPGRIMSADFLIYPDFCYMFYQYQRKNIVYGMAAKINSKGRIVGEPMIMDTTAINFWANNKIYNVINSDDKQQIGLFKINTRNDKAHVVTTSLFNSDMKLVEKHAKL